MLSESDLLFVEDDFTLPELLEPPDLVLLEDLTVLLEPELFELFVDVFPIFADKNRKISP